VHRLAENTVVGPDEELSCRFYDDWSSRRAHTGIDYSQMNRIFREIAKARAERKGCRRDVLRRDLMRDVDDLRRWVRSEDGALDGGHKIVGGAEIGQKSDHRYQRKGATAQRRNGAQSLRLCVFAPALNRGCGFSAFRGCSRTFQMPLCE